MMECVFVAGTCARSQNKTQRACKRAQALRCDPRHQISNEAETGRFLFFRTRISRNPSLKQVRGFFWIFPNHNPGQKEPNKYQGTRNAEFEIGQIENHKKSGDTQEER